MDWRSEIVKGVLIHQRLSELDSRGIWEYHFPEVAASEDEVDATERGLGYSLDPEYRQFLRYANGWRSFYQHVDILGTMSLAGGSVMGAARSQLDAVEPDIFESEAGLGIADVLPIAASTRQLDTFLVGLPWSKRPGVIIWFAGSSIEAFPGFNEFYLSMLDYNRRQVSMFESGWPSAGGEKR